MSFGSTLTADSANTRSKTMSFTVDVHHHILPDIFWRATNDAHSPVGGILPAPWSKESTLSFMDDAEIDVAITSISTPGVHMGDDSAARDLARRVNELSAELIRERPDRFGGFAALPFGMGQVLFGSDYPYLRRDLAVACRHEVETSSELHSEESRAVLAGNALKLFPRLAARVPKQDAAISRA